MNTKNQQFWTVAVYFICVVVINIALWVLEVFAIISVPQLASDNLCGALEAGSK